MLNKNVVILKGIRNKLNFGKSYHQIHIKISKYFIDDLINASNSVNRKTY